MHSDVKFFLGANSNNDFVSYFHQLQDTSVPLQLLILKGGPGSGKSTLMKRVLAHAQKCGHVLEIIPCASDPLSLDAVIDKTINFAIMDGTAPHTLDPLLPGALHHIMYTGKMWNTAVLSGKKEEIASANTRVGDYHKAATSYIKAAGALLKENMRYSERHINKSACTHFVTEALRALEDAPQGSEHTRLLSAVSVGKIESFPETVSALADNIFLFDDRWGGAADYIMKALLFHARLFSLQVIHCPCSILPQKTDHLIFPGIKTAFCTGIGNFSFPHASKIACENLYLPMKDTLPLQTRLDDALLLLDKASLSVKEAKLLHDTLEGFYKEAMDFSKADEFFDDILDRFYL